MKALVFLTWFAAISATGQERHMEDLEKIYHHVIHTHLDKKTNIINEIFTPLKEYDVDGNYERWFSPPFTRVMVCVIPIPYERTVLEFLQSQNIHLDTASIFRQIEMAKVDSLSKYKLNFDLIPSSRAPIGHSFLGNFFKKKRAVGLSPVYFDEKNFLAIVKTQMYSRNKQSEDNPSQIIILQKQGLEWKTIGILRKKL